MEQNLPDEHIHWDNHLPLNLESSLLLPQQDCCPVPGVGRVVLHGISASCFRSLDVSAHLSALACSLPDASHPHVCDLSLQSWPWCMSLLCLHTREQRDPGSFSLHLPPRSAAWIWKPISFAWSWARLCGVTSAPKLLGGSTGKEPAYTAGNPGSTLGQEDPLEKNMATHSGFLVWEFRGQRGLAGYSPGVPKSWTRLSDEQTPNRIKLSLGLGLKSHICFASFPFFLVSRCLPLLFFWENSVKSYLYTNSHLNVCFWKGSLTKTHAPRQASRLGSAERSRFSAALSSSQTGFQGWTWEFAVGKAGAR